MDSPPECDNALGRRGGARSICQHGTLGQPFDLDRLIKDWSGLPRGVTERIGEEIRSAEVDNELSNYLRAYDVSDGVPLCIPGLILGYPIENRISLYHEWGA